MSDLEDFEDFEDSEEKEEKTPKQTKKKGKANTNQKRNQAQIVIEEEAPAQAAAVSNKELERMKERLYGAANQSQEIKQKLNIAMTSPATYRLSTLYFASSAEFYRNTEAFIDYYDGTYHIKEFEKNCSLPQLKSKMLVSLCEQNEKDRIKRFNKDKKRDHFEGDIKEDVKQMEFDEKRDLNGDHPYQSFKEALEESNPLNSYEYYDDMYKMFCDQLDQNTEQTNIVEKLELHEHREVKELEYNKRRDSKHYSGRKQSQHGSQHDLFSGHSPHSNPNAMESFHSFTGDTLFGGNRSKRAGSFANDSERGGMSFSRADTDQVKAPRRKFENNSLRGNEKNIVADFEGLLRRKQRMGKLKFSADTILKKENATASHPLFKYDSISNHDDIGILPGIGKRTEKEVYLDYDRPIGMPIKQIKFRSVASDDYNYSNTDLIYSTWYDAIIVRINGEPDVDMRKMLLIDLNDKSVFYSKLISLINEKPIIEEPTANKGDMPLSSMPNSKFLEKILNKTKKDIRIRIAKGKGGNETEDRAKDELMNEEDIKRINLLNQPNPTAQDVGTILGSRNVPLGRLAGAKKVRKIINYHHSEVANSFQFNIFKMTKDRIENLHRFDIGRSIMSDIFQDKNAKWQVKVLNNSDANYPLKKQLNRRRQAMGDINTQEIHHSQEIFKKFNKLSLRNDDFVLFEYIEKNPLMLSNVGMASRLTKYYYHHRIIKKIVEEVGFEEMEIVKQFRTFLRDKLGEQGEEAPLDDNEQLPLLGQLNSKHEGLVILENNLYRVPVFKQRARKNDFILVKVVEKNEVKYFLRRIKTVYTAGQIQPKSEVYCPYSRQFRFFLKKLLKFCINRSFATYNSVKLKDLQDIFLTMNDHNLRKNIKMLGGEQDPNDNKFYVFNSQLLQENKSNDYADEIEATISPEDLCLYERMYQTYYNLCDFGIQKLKSSDKISVIKTKFYRNNLDRPDKCAVARRIIQELMLTSWNLSQSFLSAIQTQGRMYLKGYGDPTNGHGGMNFIKLPLKISRYESQLFRKAKKGKPNQMVTGTDADLRRLPMVFVHETLKKFGYTEDTLATLERWDKIELLREISNNQPADERMKDLDKFRREIRMTTKMQKEKYQSDINEMLMTLIQHLTVQSFDDIESDDEMDLEEDMGELIKAEEKEIAKYRNLNSDEDESDEEEDEEESSGDDDDDRDANTEGRDLTADIESKIEFD